MTSASSEKHPRTAMRMEVKALLVLAVAAILTLAALLLAGHRPTQIEQQQIGPKPLPNPPAAPLDGPSPAVPN